MIIIHIWEWSWWVPLQDGWLPAPVPHLATALWAADRASPHSKGAGGADFISMQTLYVLWEPPELILQVNSFLSAVEYFIFPISESTYVKRKKKKKSNQPSPGLWNK